MNNSRYIHNLTHHSARQGYAILFTIVVVSIVSTIAMGLSGSAYKQLVLSSVAKDSQSAFYQSDTAIECALYADFKLGGPSTNAGLASGTWNCGKDDTPLWKDAILSLDTTTQSDMYLFSQNTISGAGSGVRTACFEFDVNKSDPAQSVVRGRGYNNCDKKDPKTVEREIEVTY